jgi:nitronate monooxygenase
VNENMFARLGIRIPIFQAPIGAIASPRLAAAVSNAGGIGHLAWTWSSLDDIKTQCAAMRSTTQRAWGANFVLGFPIEPKLELALELGVRVISFFWEHAGKYVPRVHQAGALAIQIVGSVESARRAADAGFDLIVAQGRDAGGHVRGEVGTICLVPEVVDAVCPLPVLAAGGIADRRGVSAALALGAAGVWVGTRFIVARESNAHDDYRAAVMKASADETLYSTVFDIGWPDAPLRTIHNSTTQAWNAAGRPSRPNRPGEGDRVAQRHNGDPVVRYSFSAPTQQMEGNAAAMALYAGQGVGLVTKIEAAAEIVAELSRGFISGTAKS